MGLRIIGVDKVEYKEMRLNWNWPEFMNTLNDLGKDGWELIYREGDRWLFKRVIREIN